ncbi:MAG TPA: 50S ribosomal protein L3 [Gammaproteobacteria bacterium]|nr:50S ribosomal protein L3 [Gammaproteobacteria bacterium]
MALGIVGRKCGMTTIFNDSGAAVPVTVIEVLPNRITQVKTTDNDGYRAVQVTYGRRKQNRVNKPTAGVLAKAAVEAGEGFVELRLADGEGKDLAAGQTLTVELFKAGQKVDVAGTTIGKGFAGTIKRHHFASGDATHGNSLSHRTPGSTGQRQTPGRVFKGKRMYGHLGNVRRSAMNLEVVGVDKDRQLILVTGAVPGARGGNVLIRPTTKVRR